MDKILYKLKVSQRKAEEMRSSISTAEEEEVPETSHSDRFFHMHGWKSSFRACFTGHSTQFCALVDIQLCAWYWQLALYMPLVPKFCLITTAYLGCFISYTVNRATKIKLRIVQNSQNGIFRNQEALQCNTIQFESIQTQSGTKSGCVWINMKLTPNNLNGQRNVIA